jgi:hypothetical protein
MLNTRYAIFKHWQITNLVKYIVMHFRNINPVYHIG